MESDVFARKNHVCCVGMMMRDLCNSLYPMIPRAAATILLIAWACSGGPSQPDSPFGPPPPFEPPVMDRSSDLGLPAQVAEGERISCNVLQPKILHKGDNVVRIYVSIDGGPLERVFCFETAGLGSPAFLKQWEEPFQFVRGRAGQIIEVIYLLTFLGRPADEIPEDPADEWRVTIPVVPAG